jgi:predicted NACHT family NTPase
MVLGQPGGGKTTFLRRIGWECLRTHGILARSQSGNARYAHELLPVLVELRQCRNDERASLIELMARELKNSGFPESVQMVERMLDKGQVLVLLDALDEVAKDRVLTVIDQAKELTRRYSKLSVYNFVSNSF